MKIKDITIEDIKDGKSWKIIDYNTGDIEVTTNIRNNDYIFIFFTLQLLLPHQVIPFLEL